MIGLLGMWLAQHEGGESSRHCMCSALHTLHQGVSICHATEITQCLKPSKTPGVETTVDLHLRSRDGGWAVWNMI